MYFQYGEAETAYLSARDERMAAVIAQAGHIEREVDTDLFSAVVHHIVGQQISTKAQATIWKRMRDEFGVVDAAAVLGAGVEKLQSFGMTFRKAEYITDFARKIESGEFDLEGIRQRPDDEAIRELRSRARAVTALPRKTASIPSRLRPTSTSPCRRSTAGS